MAVEILDRAVWKARAPERRHPAKMPTPKLWLHHSAGAQDKSSNDVWADDVLSIQSFHMDIRGWSDIAYSFLADESGQVWEGRGAGVAGGHTLGHNTISHGLCAIGNYEIAHPSLALLESLAQLVAHGRLAGWWATNITGPHKAVSATQCCGKNLIAKIPEINARADSIRLAVNPPAAAEAHPAAGSTGHLIPLCLEELNALTVAARGKNMAHEEYVDWSKDLVKRVYEDGETDLSGVTRWAFWQLSQEG